MQNVYKKPPIPDNLAVPLPAGVETALEWSTFLLMLPSHLACPEYEFLV
jgi:hypothetical protein